MRKTLKHLYSIRCISLAGDQREVKVQSSNLDLGETSDDRLHRHYEY